MIRSLRSLLCGVASLAALALGTQALAASGCTTLYALTNTGTNIQIQYIGNDGAATSIITTTATSLNAAALDPVTGNVYYIDRSNSGANQNDLRVFNPNTRADTLLSSLPTPAGGNGGVAVGGTFDNSTGTPRLFLLYSNFTMQEINKTTGAVVRTLNVNLPATDVNGVAIRKPTQATSATTTTSGDFVFIGGILYATIDAETTTQGAVYYVNLGAPPTTGTTGTITGTSAVRLGRGSTATFFPVKGVVGIAINPVTNQTYVANGSFTVAGTSFTGGIGTLDTTSGVVTPLNVPSQAFTDLSDCNVAPDVPAITKSFATSPIRTNGSTVLTINIGNTNPSAYYTQNVITDTFPSGIVIAQTPGVSTTCTNADGTAATITATAGGTSVTFPDSMRVIAGGCKATVNVTGTTRGLKTNVISASTIDTTAGKPTADGTATLLVNDPITSTLVKTQRLLPSGTATTSPINVKPQDQIEYCITSTHSGVGYADATVAKVTDILSNNLTFLANRYNSGTRDVQVTRNGVVSYTTYAATVNGQTLSYSILPFDSTNNTVSVCFQATVK